MGTNSVTLDSWAVLAWLQGEPAGALVRDLLRWAGGVDDAAARVSPLIALGPDQPTILLNVLNLGEVFYILGRRFGIGTARDTIRDLRTMPIRIVPADDTTVMEAASIKVCHRVSFADAVAAATARLNDSMLITGDPELKALPDVVVHWIGPQS